MNDPTPQIALPDDAWDADTRRILARTDDFHARVEDDPDAYAALLAHALATPAD